MTNVGSTLATNAALRRPPGIALRHQFDYAFHCPELRSVDFTAAANDDSLLRSVDATDGTSRSAELKEVCHTAVSWTTFELEAVCSELADFGSKATPETLSLALVIDDCRTAIVDC